jgi:hypothetical protein
LAVTNEIPLAPDIHEGTDSSVEPKSRIREASETLSAAVRGINDAIEAGRKPGRPLHILANIAREAPLGSLLVAFLLGVAVGRRMG